MVVPRINRGINGTPVNYQLPQFNEQELLELERQGNCMSAKTRREILRKIARDLETYCGGPWVTRPLKLARLSKFLNRYKHLREPRLPGGGKGML